jgi:lysophospholipase L1-like esterase
MADLYESLGRGRGGRARRRIPGAELPFFSVLAVLVGLVALEGLAMGIEQLYPYSRQVLPYMDFQPATMDRSSCGPEPAQVACSLLEQDLARTNVRLISTCSAAQDDPSYEAFVPGPKAPDEFRVLVLGASSVFHYNRRPEPLVEATALAQDLGDGEGVLTVLPGTPPPPAGDSWWKLGDEVVVVNESEGDRWTLTRGDPGGSPSADHAAGARLTPYRPADVFDSAPPGLGSAESERSCALGIVGRLEARLRAKLPDGVRPVVINGSYPGIGTSDLVGVMQHLPEGLAPDLVVIYAGHNEFMDFTYPFLEGDSEVVPMRQLARRSHLYRLILFGLRALADLQERALPPEGYRPWTVFENRAHLCLEHAFDDVQLFNPRDWQQVREDVSVRLTVNLRFLVHQARAGGAGVVLAQVASNPRLPPCFGARQPLFVDLANRSTEIEQWTRLDEGERELNEAHFARALELFDQAVAADPEATLPHSGRARALDGLGRGEEAAEAYWATRERAIGDFSSPALVNETIAALAAEMEVPLLDVPALFVADDREREQPPYHSALIYDEVHPNEAGSDLIAGAVIDLARAAGLLPMPSASEAPAGEQPAASEEPSAPQ